MQALQRRWQQQLADRQSAGKSWRGENYVADKPIGFILTNPTNGRPMNVRSVDSAFARIRDAAGLDQERLHGLRRMFTTLMDKSGVSERVTMQAAGHKTPAMTRYYQDPFESQLIEAATLVDAELRAILAAETQGLHLRGVETLNRPGVLHPDENENGARLTNDLTENLTNIERI